MKNGMTISLVAILFSLPIISISYDRQPIKVFNNFNETLQMHLMNGKNPFEGLLEGNLIFSGKSIDLYVMKGIKHTQNFIEFKEKEKDNGMRKWIFTFSRQNQYAYAKTRIISEGLAVSYDINVNTNTLHAIYLCSQEYAHSHQGLCT